LNIRCRLSRCRGEHRDYAGGRLVALGRKVPLVSCTGACRSWLASNGFTINLFRCASEHCTTPGIHWFRDFAGARDQACSPSVKRFSMDGGTAGLLRILPRAADRYCWAPPVRHAQPFIR
jgi:hypothetical protein